MSERKEVNQNLGEQCCVCHSGTIKVTKTIPNHEAGKRIRYLGCKVCGWTGKSVVPLRDAPGRQKIH